MMLRYLYCIVCIITHKDLCIGVVQKVGVQSEVLLEGKIEQEITRVEQMDKVKGNWSL